MVGSGKGPYVGDYGESFYGETWGDLRPWSGHVGVGGLGVPLRKKGAQKV